MGRGSESAPMFPVFPMVSYSSSRCCKKVLEKKHRTKLPGPASASPPPRIERCFQTYLHPIATSDPSEKPPFFALCRPHPEIYLYEKPYPKSYSNSCNFLKLIQSVPPLRPAKRFLRRLMIYILHYLKDPKLWELFLILGIFRIYIISSSLGFRFSDRDTVGTCLCLCLFLLSPSTASFQDTVHLNRKSKPRHLSPTPEA